MRDLIVTENITLDGVIEATEGWFAPAGDESGVGSSPTSRRRSASSARRPMPCWSDG